MNKLIRVLALAACTMFALPAAAQEKINLSIATGGTGGVYYPLGGGMANVFSKHIPGMQATAEVTGGSVDNMRLIGTGKPYIALAQADAVIDAYNGEGKFKGTKIPVRALMMLYTNIMHAVTVEGTGINNINDLKGRRVSTGSPGSATEVFAFRVLEAAGINPQKDLRIERLGAAESANAMKDKKIDAFFFVVGLPTSAVTDLAATPGTKIKFLDHANLLPAMVKQHGNIYIADVIPRATYPGMTADNQATAVANLLVANANMSDEVAYNIVKTVFDRRPDLIAVHKTAADITLEKQKAEASPVPWHPGAVKYFKEKGLKF
ncbi:MAG: TAXI family TRAP transporter solute-binding subunit [Burkholderiales bacterium]|nr:TAXI family TRAP transporter solute-binding subunit [Burkholderiales bacterium]MDP2399545.1 TAXI family TRAP transporter solute-binding subunit [Burkholderiales bacterium]